MPASRRRKPATRLPDSLPGRVADRQVDVNVGHRDIENARRLVRALVAEDGAMAGAIGRQDRVIAAVSLTAMVFVKALAQHVDDPGTTLQAMLDEAAAAEGLS